MKEEDHKILMLAVKSCNEEIKQADSLMLNGKIDIVEYAERVERASNTLEKATRALLDIENNTPH